MRKRVIFGVIAFLFVFSFSIGFVSALGVSPAIIEVNYVPGEQYEVELYIHGPDPNRMINVYAEGEAASFITLDKTQLKGRGTVTATITLPDNLETPGKNRFYISAAEAPLNDRIIGTAIIIKSTLIVYVPYPGKYLEASLSVPNANLNEKVPVELTVVNRGTQALTVAPVISFYDSSGKKVQSMEFNPINIVTGQEESFARYLNTSGLQPDEYLAEAVIDYGEILRVNRTFKLGDLAIDIINFTEEMEQAELSRFFVRVKNNWNGILKGVYSDVSIFNETYRGDFRTPPVDLQGWEEKDIVGYFETGELRAGEYDLDVIVNYGAESDYASGKLTITSKPLPIFWIVGGVVAVLIIAVVIFILVRKGGRKKGRRK